ERAVVRSERARENLRVLAGRVDAAHDEGPRALAVRVHDQRERQVGREPDVSFAGPVDRYDRRDGRGGRRCRAARRAWRRGRRRRGESTTPRTRTRDDQHRQRRGDAGHTSLHRDSIGTGRSGSRATTELSRALRSWYVLSVPWTWARGSARGVGLGAGYAAGVGTASRSFRCSIAAERGVLG